MESGAINDSPDKCIKWNRERDAESVPSERGTRKGVVCSGVGSYQDVNYPPPKTVLHYTGKSFQGAPNDGVFPKCF